MKKNLLAASPMFPRSTRGDQKERVQVPRLCWAGLALCLLIPASGSRAQQSLMLLSRRACGRPPCCGPSSVWVWLCGGSEAFLGARIWGLSALGSWPNLRGISICSSGWSLCVWQGWLASPTSRDSVDIAQVFPAPLPCASSRKPPWLSPPVTMKMWFIHHTLLYFLSKYHGEVLPSLSA